MNTELGAARPIVLSHTGKRWMACRGFEPLYGIEPVGLGPTPAWAMHALKKAEDGVKPVIQRGVW